LVIDWNQVSSAITAIATVGLAIYAYKSFKGVKDQMDLIEKQSTDMKRQADAMEIQSSLIRSQSDAMERQADIMDRQTNFVRDQSLAMQKQASTMLEQASNIRCQSNAMDLQSQMMIERMNFEWSIKKHERVSKEMSLFIGLLYSRRKDPSIFLLKKRSQRVIQRDIFNSQDMVLDFVSFWDFIDQNFYLNRSKDLKEAFLSYNNAIDEYFELKKIEGKSQEKIDAAKNFNDNIKPKLITLIEKRYEEVSKELTKIESEFESRII
jgi:hypothetical protein